MNKNEFINKFAESNQISKAAAADMIEKVVSEMIDTIINDSELYLTGLGTFVVRETPEKVGRNPHTGEEIIFPAHNILKFKPSCSLKAAVK